MSTEDKGRLRFKEFTFERHADGGCRVTVILQWPGEESFVGVADALGDTAAALRCSAQATIHALHAAVGDEGRFELLGVKSVKAFDSSVIIVALSAEHKGNVQRLIGSYLAAEENERCAALAVMHATNRYLGNTIFAR